MTRQQIIDRLKVDRDWHHFRSDSAGWRDAFTLYDAAHGLTGKEKMRLNCTKCFQVVRDWLETGKG